MGPKVIKNLNKKVIIYREIKQIYMNLKSKVVCYAWHKYMFSFVIEVIIKICFKIYMIL